MYLEDKTVRLQLCKLDAVSHSLVFMIHTHTAIIQGIQQDK